MQPDYHKGIRLGNKSVFYGAWRAMSSDDFSLFPRYVKQNGGCQQFMERKKFVNQSVKKRGTG